MDHGPRCRWRARFGLRHGRNPWYVESDGCGSGIGGLVDGNGFWAELLEFGKWLLAGLVAIVGYLIRADWLDMKTKAGSLADRVAAIEESRPRRHELSDAVAGLRSEVREDLNALKHEVRSDIAELKTEIRADLRELINLHKAAR